jgi:trigger factor
MSDATVTVEDLTPIRKRLQIEVPADRVRSELDRAFEAVGQRARVRGFRPGKVPRRVLEQMFGADVRREVVGRLVEESLHHAVESHRLVVVSTPDVDAHDLVPGEALRYSATVEIRPEIRIGDVSGLVATRPDAAGHDADRVLESLRESVAQLRPVDDRTVIEPGDVVTVDLSSRVDGAEPVAREGVLLEAGGGAFPLALERQLVGQHRGARLSLRVPYPADYGNPGLAGKTAEFDLEVKDLRTKELPPLDDDFARDHGRCESLAELRSRVRADLERQAEEQAEGAVRESIVDQLLARHEFEVPPSLLERRADALAASLGVRLPEGAERERALEELRARLRPRAERQLRTELLLDTFAAREGLTVDDAALDAEIEAIATREREVLERVRAFYARPEAREALRAKLRRDRAIAQIIGTARVVPSGPRESVAHEK